MSEVHGLKGMEVKFHIFKASVLGRGEWSVSRISPLYSWERDWLHMRVCGFQSRAAHVGEEKQLD
jgi:hypothetical protein